jgi:hypothetical protein
MDQLYNSESVVVSRSPIGNGMVVVEPDTDFVVVYAIEVVADASRIVDQESITGFFDKSAIAVVWNAAGIRAGVVLKGRLTLVYDFDRCITNAPTINPDFPSTWTRQAFAFTRDLALEFGLDRFIKQPQLEQAIDALIATPSFTQRLAFYKELLTAFVFVPITTDDPEDPSANVYTFPHTQDGGQVMCGYTTMGLFQEQMGQFGLACRKFSADFLCHQAQAWDGIVGLMITSQQGNTVAVTRDEFQLLSLIAHPHRRDPRSLITELGQVFFADCHTVARQSVADFYNQTLRTNTAVRAGYYCQINGRPSTPLFCVIVRAGTDSNAITAIVKAVNAWASSDCDHHILSETDTVARALLYAKTPL